MRAKPKVLVLYVEQYRSLKGDWRDILVARDRETIASDYQLWRRHGLEVRLLRRVTSEKVIAQ